MPPSRAESRATTVGKWLFALVVPASGLAMGSLPNDVLVLMSAVAALACALLSIEPAAPPSRATRWVLLAFGLLLVTTVVQAVPFPAAVARALTPANADIWDRALSPLHEDAPAWHSLSIAPAATRVEILRGFFYGCIFLSTLRIAALAHGESFLVRLVVFAAGMMAISALAHQAVGAEKVFGVYRPRDTHAYRVGHFSPLLNLNHLAAYLNVGACVAIWALLARRALPRPLALSAALVLVATSVWQGSRGATGGLVLGVVLTLALTMYAKRRFDSGRANAGVLAVCGIAAAFMGSLALSDIARDRLMSRELTKVEIADTSIELIRSSPWFGVGRGGFEAVFSSVWPGTTYVSFTNPEDLLVQWTVEWGVPVSLVGLGMLGWALRPQILLRAVHPAVGVWAAIVALVMSDLVDFHLEVPGVVALVAVCVGIVVSGCTRSSSQVADRPQTSTLRYAAVLVVAGTAVAAVLVLPDAYHSLGDDRRALSELAIDKTTSPEQFRSVIRAAMLRYPSEPFIPLMGAVRAQSREEGSVVPWVARALERNPRFGRAHFVLARSLGDSHAPQARLEYRLAYANDLYLRDQIVKEGARLIDSKDSALEMVPDGPTGTEMLDDLVTAIVNRLPSTAAALDVEIERRSKTATGPLRRRVAALVLDAIEGAPWCSGKRCVQEGLEVAGTLVAREPTRCESHLFMARLRVANGEAGSGIDTFARAIEGVTGKAACQRELIGLALSSNEIRRGELALERLVRGGCGATADCVDLYLWAAGMEEARGRMARAVLLYRRVLDVVPDRDDLLEHVGELGTHQGLLNEGVRAYNTLASRHPEDPRWPARLAELGRRAVPAASALPP
jgi:hypothetical protein